MAMNRTAENVKIGVEESASGLTLVELVIAATVLTVAFGGMGTLLVSLTRQRGETEKRTIVAMEAENKIEEITGMDPNNIQTAYDGTTYFVSGIEGDHPDDSVLSVSVVYQETRLLAVTVTGAWRDEGITRNLVLYTEFYDPDG